MNRKVKVLIITTYPWREDNNIGNSYSNLFAGMDDRIEFSQIYMRDGMPQNSLAKDYYHISQMKLLKKFFWRTGEIGRYFHLEYPMDTPKDTFSKSFNLARTLRWQILLLIRELAGFNKQWKTKQFDDFINHVNPDVVFGTLPDEKLNSDLMLYVKEQTGARLITYPWDDYYSLKHKSLSPIFWIRKFMARHYLRRTARQSEFLYVISDIMRREYTEIFGKECKLLYKGHHFDNMSMILPVNSPIRLIYMGNVGGGRWKTLAFIANSISNINKKHGKSVMMLNVYTLSAKTPQIETALNVDGVSALLPPVETEDVQKTMNAADVLLHVEPWSGSECSFYRASFSTKLVDYFYSAKCIMAVGGATASTGYLKDKDAAIVVNRKEDVEKSLYTIIDNRNLIGEYAQKAWECGKKNHQIDEIQKMLYNDFKRN